MSTAEKSERPERNQDLRCQSGPSSQRFSHLQRRRLFNELWSRPTTTADFGSPQIQLVEEPAELSASSLNKR